jgi:pimeloyl-ACP methyl ester carboxylesterase
VRVEAGDGTGLAVRVTGNGPPLVLAHGSTASKDAWVFVEPLLAERHTVWVYDRRGRGESGDAQPYEYEREVDDLETIVARAGGSVHLLGHSFGARLVLDAVANLRDLLSVVLYEPPLHLSPRADAVDAAARLIEEGREADGLLLFFRQLAGISEEEIAMLQAMPPVWAESIAAAPTVAREIRALLARGAPAGPVRSSGVRTMFLAGGLNDFPVFPTRADERALVPDAAHVELSGQRHLAFATDPEGFASAVVRFTDPRPACVH